jgi:general secretion pathway protein A
VYENFFRLQKTPFSTVPDPNCVHLVGQHADAISGLTYGVMARKGYLVLTGEAGLGKTTAVGAMVQLLSDANVQLGLVLNPILTSPEFMEMALMTFGFENIPLSKTQRLKMLQEFLIRSDRDGKTSALIIDEAHKLSAELLEEVRLLGNFEANDHKLLQIVLVGQNELNDRLNRPDLWQLKQRIVVRMALQRLDRDAVEQYLRFRWSKAGGSDPIPFTESAIDAIAAWSLGIPRMINAICDNALLIAFGAASETVDVPLIREACTELDLPTPPLRTRLKTPAPAALAPAPILPRIDFPVAEEPAVARDTAPQFWQYSGPSLKEKAAHFVADDKGGIPYRAPLVEKAPFPLPFPLPRRVLLTIAGVLVLIGVTVYTAYRLPNSPQAPVPTVESPVKVATAPPAERPAAPPLPKTLEAAPPIAASEPSVAAPFVVGGEAQEANLIERVAPIYPDEVIREHIQGNVRLTALIGKDGTVKDLKVIGGTPELIQPIIDAVQQWRYRPLVINGEPVEVATEIDVNGPSEP